MATNHNNFLDQSSNSLEFTTKGQDYGDSISAPVRSDESSIRVEYNKGDEATISTYLTYQCNKSSTVTHTIDWTFTSNHNTKGYIKNDGFKVSVVGPGESPDNPVPVEGGQVKLKIEGISYEASSDDKGDRIVFPTVYYKFPSNDSLNEEGTGEEEIEVSANLLQEPTNTENPNLRIEIDEYKGNLSGYDEKNKTFDSELLLNFDSNGKFAMSGATSAYMDSNIPTSGSLGTYTGKFIATVSNDMASATGETVEITCSSNNLKLVPADNTESVTSSRQDTMDYYVDGEEGIYGEELDRYNLESWKVTGWVFGSITAYQAGGNFSVPNPSLSISALFKGNYYSYGDFTEGIISDGFSNTGDILRYTWNSNEGIKGNVTGRLYVGASQQTKSECSVVDRSATESTITLPDNTGTEITLDISGYDFTNPVNTQSRTIEGFFNIISVNDREGKASSLSNMKNSDGNRYVPFEISQAGKTNPIPSFTMEYNVAKSSTNPDQSIDPTVEFNDIKYSKSANKYYFTIDTYTHTQPTIKLTFPYTRPAPVGSSTNDVISKIGAISEIAALKSIPSKGGTYPLTTYWNYTTDDFASGHTPAQGAFTWTAYCGDIAIRTGVDNEMSVSQHRYNIVQPGNAEIQNGSFDTVRINVDSVSGKGGSVSPSQMTLTCSQSSSGQKSLVCSSTDNKFYFTASPNNASISTVSMTSSKVNNSDYYDMRISHNGVNSSTREGTILFVKPNYGILKTDGNASGPTANKLSIPYSIAGENYGGTIKLSTRKLSSEGEGTVSIKKNIDLSSMPSGDNSTIYKLSDYLTFTAAPATIDGSTFALPKSVVIPAASTTYTISCNPATTKDGMSSTWGVYATIQGTVNGALNNTVPSGLDSEGKVGEVATPIQVATVPSSYYNYQWTSESGIISSISTNYNEVTVNCSSNTNLHDSINPNIDFFGDGYWVKMNGSRTGYTENRKIGSLAAAWKSNTPTMSVDVMQLGIPAYDESYISKCEINYYNCTGHINTDNATNLSSSTVTLTSTGPDDIQTITGTDDTTKWDNCSLYNSLTGKYDAIFTTNNYIGSNNYSKTIGAFDDDIDVYIGPDLSELVYTLTYQKIVRIGFSMGKSGNGNSESSLHVYGTIGSETINLKESDLSKIELTWSDGVTTGKTRHVHISASNPGTYTYTCTAINIEYSFINKIKEFNGNYGATVVLNDGIHNGTDCSHTPITWTFTVDSKHYYNA